MMFAMMALKSPLGNMKHLEHWRKVYEKTFPWRELRPDVTIATGTPQMMGNYPDKLEVRLPEYDVRLWRDHDHAASLHYC